MHANEKIVKLNDTTRGTFNNTISVKSSLVYNTA